MMESYAVSGSRGWLAAVVACVLLVAGPAAAQETGSEPGDEESESNDASAAEGADDDQEYPPEVYDPAWARYREAFVALAAGNHTEALEKLRTVRKEHEDHAAALFAGPVIDQLEQTIAEKDEKRPERQKESKGAGESTEPPPPSKTDRLGLERPTGLARAELVTYQTLHGIVLGAQMCVVVQCLGARPFIGSLVLGGGTGLGLSLYGTRDGITPGRASAINAGVQWGFVNAAALNTITDNWANWPPAGTFVPLMAGQLAGLGGGYLVARELRPHAGDVALANSTGLWSGVFTGLFTAAIGAEVEPRGLVTALLVTSDLGLVAGGFLASEHPMPRGRVYVINTGGLLGGLLGAGVAVLFGGDFVSQQGTGAMTMLGAGGGLALSTVLTSDWPLDEGGRGPVGDTSFSVQPARNGEGAVLSIGGEF